MRFFIAPYEIHFDDTMAYGSHHFMTNFKFQCAGREHLLFSDELYRDPAFRADFEQVILYTAEAFSRNLGPARLGDRLIVLTSVEERTSIGLRFCFRVLNEAGEPVSCGFQSVLCAARSGGIVAFPASFEAAFDRVADIVEVASESSFRERVLRGGREIKGLFPDSLRDFARATAGKVQTGVAGIGGQAALKLPAGARVVLLGGQGTFDAAHLQALVLTLPEAQGELVEVAQVVKERLGVGLAPLLRGDAAAAVAACPDLDQVGIFLSGVLGARLAARDGEAHLVIGHSFGEIAALVVGGVLTLRDGAEAVCQRVLSLRGCEGLGTLAAVGLDQLGTRELLAGEPGLVVAGLNHGRQTVVAGEPEAIERLVTAAGLRGRPVTRVSSRYPFHHPALRPAAERYGAALRGLATRAPSVPVWSPIDRALYTGAPGEVAAALSGHLVRSFDFLGALTMARAAGATTFVDTTGGRIGRIVHKALGEEVSVIEVRPVAADAPAEVAVRSDLAEDDIAIVSLGCLFPGGGRDPEAFWQAMAAGRVGVSEDPSLDADFVSRALVADKALTTLAGRVDEADVVLPAELEGRGWCRVQRLLAGALVQAVGGVRIGDPSRVHCLIGSTADGSDALDLALASEAMLGGLGEGRQVVERVLEAGLGVGAAQAASLSPHAALSEVVRAVVGGAGCTLVDAACASSLYAVGLGAAMLRSGEADLVLAGGAFAPGPGNNALFSQFKGLSTTGIRPFDVSADGVVFGEGAGLVGLKRLADAERDGDRIFAVVRGVGLSSDGRSSSANVPRAEGQLLAIERAYAQIDPDTVAFVEAHGTATPAGDKTELDALKRFFGPRVERRIPIGSLKAHTGHLGWVAGVASLIKLCKMMEHGVLPRQHTFRTAGTSLAAVEDRFEVLTADRAWPRGSQPRRAATSGFGFGGTNAHVVLEEHLAGSRRPAVGARRGAMAVVAVHAVLPQGQEARLTADQLGLPAGVRVLPDLVDELDPTQRLAVAGARAVLSGLGEAGERLRPRTSVVLALEGKTERGVEAIQRVLGTRVFRLLTEAGVSTEGVAAHLGRLRPSNAYTLQGMMPNVTPGRVANLLDLQGPNLVVDRGAASLGAALEQAASLLDLGSELVIAGGVHVGGLAPVPGGRSPAGDGLVMLALARPEVARERGLEVLALIEAAGPGEVVAAAVDRRGAAFEAGSALGAVAGAVDRRGAAGGAELVAAVAAARRGGAAAVVLPGGRSWLLRSPVKPTSPEPEKVVPTVAPSGFGQAAQVRYGAPVLMERAARGSALSWAGRRVLLLADGAVDDVMAALRAAGAAVDLRLAAGPGAVDLSTEAAAEEALAGVRADLLLMVRRAPQGREVAELVAATGDRALLDLSFVVLKRLYGQLLAGGLDVMAVHLGGLEGGMLHPATGLLAGMLKSVAREVPAGRVRTLSTDHGDAVLAMDQVAQELSTDRDPVIESAWAGQRRQVRVLRELETTASGPSPLDRRSVVVATGGARGVTAVLVEELLRRHGCTVVLVGRTALGDTPAEILAASEGALDVLEQAFYAREAERDPTVRIGDLRRRFERWRSGHELHHTLQRLRGLPGTVVYRAVDVTRQGEVEELMAEVEHRFGRLDLVVHGAGLQTSKKLDRRKLDELRRNMDVKLLGLARLHAASARFGDVPFHVLTSAFSYFGNDGQADYGAANETLDRLCAAVGERGGRVSWTSIGWLAWDRIGMTRSPEYAVLGAARNLRGISAEEGARLFSAVVEGRPQAAIFHQYTDGEVAWYGLEVLPAVVEGRPQAAIFHPYTDGEVAWYGLEVVPAVVAGADALRGVEVGAGVMEVELGADTLACLEDHLVRGTPTVPGAWALDRMLPTDLVDSPAVAVEDIAFSRFVRVPHGRRQVLRAEARAVGEGQRVRLVGDVRHASGVVLQAGVEHASASFRGLTERLRAVLPIDVDGSPAEDPYCLPSSPIELRKGFRCLSEIRIGREGRTARFSGNGAYGARRLPALLLDAAWRLSAMHADGGAVFAPVRFVRAAFDREALGRCDRAVVLRATAPRVEGELVHCDRVEAVDDEGRVLLVVDGGVAKRIS